MLFQYKVILKRNIIFESKLRNAGQIDTVKFRIHIRLNLLNQKVKKPKIIKAIQKAITETYRKIVEINPLYI